MHGLDLGAADRSYGVRVEGSFSRQMVEEDALGLEHESVMELFVKISYKIGAESPKTEVLSLFEFMALYKEAKRLHLPVRKGEKYAHAALEGGSVPAGLDILEYVEGLLRGEEASGMYG